jgi:hypothetical protein
MENEQLMYIALLIAGLVSIIYFLNQYFNNKEEEEKENYASLDGELEEMLEAQKVSQDSPEEQLKDSEKIVEKANKKLEEKTIPKANDLLPAGSEADEWSKANPKGTGSLELKNFTEAAFHIGVDTQSNSLRNANLQLRSEPANPMKSVSIFNNTTIGPDPFRRPLEIN